MDTQKHTLKDAMRHFGVSRSTLYKTLQKEGIKTIKEGRTACLSDTDFTHLKNTYFKASNKASHETDRKTHSETTENTALIDHLKAQVTAEQEKNEQLQAENKTLIQEVGRWEGVARTLQDQNQKLLEVKTAEDEADIIDTDAETVEPETTPAPEAKAEKRGFFQKIFRFK